MMKSTLLDQYSMVLDARNVLLDYCTGISTEDLVRSGNDFESGISIRNLLVHICNTYQGWFGQYAMGKDITFAAYENFPSFTECLNYFTSTNELVFSFMDHFQSDYNRTLYSMAGGVPTIATPLKLFTHVITHEFHHKGQILFLSRKWGYAPADTDIIR